MERLDLDVIDAVVFDLDDTLVDTSGQLVPAALGEAAAAMVAAGLDATVDAAHRLLLEQAEQGRGLDYFGAAVRRFGADGTARPREIAARGRRAYLTADVGCPALLPGAARLLDDLGERLPLFLVTAGDPETQRRKVRRLGIAPRFQDIRWVASVDGEDKSTALAGLLEAHGLTARRCVCVGDRIVGEIRDANRLGMVSVWMRRGEFRDLEPEVDEDRPRHVVRDMAELAALLGLDGHPEESSWSG